MAWLGFASITSNRRIFGILYDFHGQNISNALMEERKREREGEGENGNHITAGSFIHDETIFIRRGATVEEAE